MTDPVLKTFHRYCRSPSDLVDAQIDDGVMVLMLLILLYYWPALMK